MSEPVADVPHRLHDVGTQLLAKSADAHLDDVAAGVEGQTPNVGEQLLASTNFGRTPHEVLENEELLLGEVDRAVAGVSHAAAHVEQDVPDAAQTIDLISRVMAQPDLRRAERSRRRLSRRHIALVRRASQCTLIDVKG